MRSRIITQIAQSNFSVGKIVRNLLAKSFGTFKLFIRFYLGNYYTIWHLDLTFSMNKDATTLERDELK